MNEKEIKQIAACVVAELKKMNAVHSDPLAGRIMVSSGEAARMCGVSQSTWCRYVRMGYAPSPIDIGRASKWLASDFGPWCKDLRKRAIDKVFE